jgi:glycine cleavage system H lipoate-binding protein
LVNSDPLGQGWFFKMAATDVADMESMMTEEEYSHFIS